MVCWVLSASVGLGLLGFASTQQDPSTPLAEAAAPSGTSQAATAEPAETAEAATAEPIALSSQYKDLIAEAARTDDDDGLRFLLEMIRAQAGVTDQMVLDAVVDVAPRKRGLAREVLGLPEPSMMNRAGGATPPPEPETEEAGARGEPDEGLRFENLRRQIGRWSGTGPTLGLSVDASETTDSDLDITLNATRRTETGAFSFQVDYSRDFEDDLQTEDDFFASLRGERNWTTKWTRYAYVEFEADRFSSFESEWWGAGGVGYRLIDRENMHFLVRGGVGLRRLDPVEEEVRNNVGVDASADFDWQIRPWLLFRSNTLLQASENGQADQRFRLTSNFTDDWGIQISYRFKYDFDPVLGFAADKTELDLSIVRNF